jgi:hypothetical protein
MKNLMLQFMCYWLPAVVITLLADRGWWLIVAGIPLGLLLKPRYGEQE